MRKTFLLGLLLISFLSRSQEVKFPELSGWKTDGKTRIFNKENLFEHINGAAEFYLSYGFESLKVASWSNNGAELTAEVYDHGDPLHAYGIYSIEKSAKAIITPVGLEGYGDGATFNFVAGKFYVKMNSMQLEKVSGFMLRSFAEEFARILCEKPEYPKIIGLFPRENLVANSCQYIPTEFMGLGFLGSAVRARYTVDGKEVTVFILERADRTEVEKMVLKYISYAEAKVKKPGEGDFLMKDPFNGPVFLRWKGNYLLGASGFSDQKKLLPILMEITQKL
jgi:hypothetical protein